MMGAYSKANKWLHQELPMHYIVITAKRALPLLALYTLHREKIISHIYLTLALQSLLYDDVLLTHFIDEHDYHYYWA